MHTHKHTHKHAHKYTLPADNGTADIAVVQSADVSSPEREMASKNWDKEEYESAMWVQPTVLMSDAQYHPALKRWVPDLGAPTCTRGACALICLCFPALKK